MSGAPTPDSYSCFKHISLRDDEPYVPPTKPYELSELVRDLVLLSRHLLKVNGRLVFFLPTVTDEYAEIDVQAVMCEGMQIVANSLQDFGSWGRRVCQQIRRCPDPLTSL
jgi:tRNA (guanine10-N2)-methyltransferase